MHSLPLISPYQEIKRLLNNENSRFQKKYMHIRFLTIVSMWLLWPKKSLKWLSIDWWPNELVLPKVAFDCVYCSDNFGVHLTTGRLFWSWTIVWKSVRNKFRHKHYYESIHFPINNNSNPNLILAIPHVRTIQWRHIKLCYRKQLFDFLVLWSFTAALKLH